jgi:RimJ/RimL family protein N-acetyltransferase
MTVPFLTGKQCQLVKLEAEHASESYLGWINDRQISDLTYAGQVPPSIDDLSSWIAGFDNRSSIAFAVLDIESDSHVGNATINNINWVTRTADLGLMVGDRSHVRADFIADIWRTVINYAFGNLHLRRLHTGILDPAAEYLAAVDELGFQREGNWRAHSYVNGELVDEYLFGLLVSEWNG